MQLRSFSRRRLTGASVIASAAALMPVAFLAAAASPAAAAAQRPTAVPAGLQPASASFVSPAWGVALGGVGCGPDHACRARLAATSDGGAHWRALTAPRTFLQRPADRSRPAQVSQVVFASRQDGWLYGPGLWATHDDGAHWRRILLPGNVVPALGGGVVAMAASAGTAYAVVSPDPFHGKPDELYRSPVGQNAWARVATMTGNPFASLAVSGKAAWFGTSTHLWATADGVHWHRFPFSCPGSHYGLAGIAAASRSDVTFLCASAQGMFHTDKEVLRSVNGGRTAHLTGRAPVEGDTYGDALAVPPHHPKVITIAVVSPGLSFLDRSADGGRTWAEITIPGTEGGVNLSSLSYVSRTAGWVVAGGPTTAGPGQLLLTSDSGRTWHPVTF